MRSFARATMCLGRRGANSHDTRERRFGHRWCTFLKLHLLNTSIEFTLISTALWRRITQPRWRWGYGLWFDDFLILNCLKNSPFLSLSFENPDRKLRKWTWSVIRSLWIAHACGSTSVPFWKMRSHKSTWTRLIKCGAKGHFGSKRGRFWKNGRSEHNIPRQT